MSMDQTGKIVWAKNGDIQAVNFKAPAGATPPPQPSLWSRFASLLTRRRCGRGAACRRNERPRHERSVPAGHPPQPQRQVKTTPPPAEEPRVVAVCGDGEFVIYTALGWKNKSFGTGLEFVWSADGSE